MKSTDNFKRTIQDYLEVRAKTDELFAQSYNKPNKSIDECVNYILSQVKKSGCTGFDDDEIFGMAVHYYDEDDLKDIKPITCSVVVNHKVQLTDEEKTELKEKARKEFMDEQLSKQRELLKPKKKVEPKIEQPSLFG